MPRQDIHINVAYGEVYTTDHLTNKAFYEFGLLEHVPEGEPDIYAYGEIVIPFRISQPEKFINGIYFQIPYTPVYKELKVRFRLETGSGATEYKINPRTNKQWYPVYSPNKEEIYISEYYTINENGTFNLFIEEECAYLYSAHETDLTIRAALNQNEIFLLKAQAGNLYQHPTTGVGLIHFLHGNFQNTGLAAKLQQEFESDKMVIKNAYMDSLTGELLLDVEEIE